MPKPSKTYTLVLDRQKLLWLLDVQHMSKSELARLAGLHRNTVQNLLAYGEGSNPTLDTVTALGRALGTPPTKLLAEVSE